MKRLVFITLVALTTACIAPRVDAQGTLAPLFLYTNGSGGISPLSGGQMLTAGQVYDLQANPDPGFLFSSWQSVTVFTFTEITLNSDGTTNAPLVSMVASPVPDYTLQPALQFTMQAESLILDVPGVRMVTMDSGWQANFVPVPEPSSLALILCGLAAIVIPGCQRVWPACAGGR